MSSVPSLNAFVAYHSFHKQSEETDALHVPDIGVSERTSKSQNEIIANQESQSPSLFQRVFDNFHHHSPGTCTENTAQEMTNAKDDRSLLSKLSHSSARVRHSSDGSVNK